MEPPDSGNNANFLQGDYTVGSPYYTTPVGEFEYSQSPYGTFDQDGNVWEWNETVRTDLWRNVRGGYWGSAGWFMHTSSNGLYYPSDYHGIVGFRVASNPEPPLLPGDANRDGQVSAGDYASVQANFGNTGIAGIPGDANGDGMVSAGDYASVQANFGNVAAVAQVTPEPATLSLLVLGGVALLRKKQFNSDGRII